MWRTSNEKRIERSGWASFGPQQEQTTSIPSMAAFRRIAERNQAKARIRYLRARRLDSHEDDGEVRGEDPFLDEPSEDESLPTENSDIPLSLSPELALPLASPDPRLTF